MPKIFELPNGVEAEFPDDMPEAEMYKALDQLLKTLPNQAQGQAQAPGQPAPQRKPNPHLDYENPEDFGRASGGKRFLQALGSYGPEIAASALVPELPIVGALSKIPALAKAFQSIPRAAKYGQKILGNAIPQAGVAAAFNPTQAGESAALAGGVTAPFAAASQLALSGNPAARMAGRIGGGLGGAGLGYAASQALPFSSLSEIPATLGGAVLGFRGTPTSALNRNLMKGLEGTEYKPSLEAAERLGLDYLTPAEASANPFLGAEQGNIGKTPEGARNLYQKAKGRVESETGSIQNLFETMYNPKEAAKKTKLYSEINKHKLPEEKINKFISNDIVKDAEELALKDSAFRQELKGLGRDSVGYWDVVKQKIDDMASSSSKDANKKRFGKIDTARKDLLKELDKVAPTYKDARYLHERGLAREKLEDHFSNRKMIGTNMFKAISDKGKFENFMKQMRGVPEAQQQLKDMRMVFENLINPITARSASALSRTNMNKSRSSYQDFVGAFKDALSKGKYDKSAVELITDPKWADKLHEISKLSPTEKNASKMIDLFGKALGQSTPKLLNIDYHYNEPQPDIDPENMEEEEGEY